MKIRTIKLMIGLAILSAFATTASAQKWATAPDSLLPAAPVSIVGTWLVDATPDGPPPFKGMITFAEGGTVIASAQGDILLNQNSLATAGHGAWTRVSSREFIFTFRQILYNADGDYDGAVKVRHTAVLSKDGEGWEGRLTVDFYNSNDELVFTGTGGGTARRMKAEAP